MNLWYMSLVSLVLQGPTLSVFLAPDPPSHSVVTRANGYTDVLPGTVGGRMLVSLQGLVKLSGKKQQGKVLPPGQYKTEVQERAFVAFAPFLLNNKIC